MSQKAPTLRHWKRIDIIGSFQRRYAKPRFSALHEFESNAFIREKFPYRHRLFMDNDPKHTSIGKMVSTMLKHPLNLQLVHLI